MLNQTERTPIYVEGTRDKKGYSPDILDPRDPVNPSSTPANLGTRIHTNWGGYLETGKLITRKLIGTCVRLNNLDKRSTIGEKLGDRIDYFLQRSAQYAHSDLCDRLERQKGRFNNQPLKRIRWASEPLFQYSALTIEDQKYFTTLIETGADPKAVWFNFRRYFEPIGLEIDESDGPEKLGEIVDRLVYDPDFHLKLREKPTSQAFINFAQAHNLPLLADDGLWSLSDISAFLYEVGNSNGELANYSRLISVMRHIASWSCHAHTEILNQNPHVVSNGSRWDSLGLKALDDSDETAKIIDWFFNRVAVSNGTRNYLFDSHVVDPVMAERFLDAMLEKRIKPYMVELKVETALNGKTVSGDRQLKPIKFKPVVPDFYYVDLAHSLTSALELIVRLMDGSEKYRQHRLIEIYSPDKAVRRKALHRATPLFEMLLDGVYLERVFCPFIDNRRWPDTRGIPVDFDARAMLDRFNTGKFIIDIQGVNDPNENGHSLDPKKLMWAIAVAHKRIVAEYLARERGIPVRTMPVLTIADQRRMQNVQNRGNDLLGVAEDQRPIGYNDTGFYAQV